MHVEVINRSSPVASQHAGRMGIVHHHDGSVLLGDVAELIERTDIAIHREDAVTDEHSTAWLVFNAGQLLFRVGDVFMPEDQNLGTGQPGPVDDRGVVELVRNDEIFFS